MLLELKQNHIVVMVTMTKVMSEILIMTVCNDARNNHDEVDSDDSHDN